MLQEHGYTTSFTKEELFIRRCFESNGNEFEALKMDSFRFQFILQRNLSFIFLFYDYNCDRIKCARLDVWLDIIAYIFDESFRSKLYWRTCDIGEKILDIDGYSRKFVLQHLCNRKLNQDLDNLISNFSNLTELLEEESLSRRNYWKK